MADPNDNLGNTGRSDEEVNPDLGVDEDSGMSGSTSGDESDSSSSESESSGDERDVGYGDSGSSRSPGFGDENGRSSNR
jgi:hypothetical protein